MTAIRSVALRDGLMMVGDHAVPAGGRHWKATAQAFALVDPHGHPMVWIEGAGGAAQVVGELAATVAKPVYGGRRAPGLIRPGEHDQLKWFEVLRVAATPVIRTHWALGAKADRSGRRACDEVLGRDWRERMFELLTLMGVGNG